MLTAQEAVDTAKRWGAINPYDCATELVRLQGEAYLEGLKQAESIVFKVFGGDPADA